MTSIDKSAVNTDQDRTHIAASFAVNEDLSVSWGMSTVEFEDGSKVTKKTLVSQYLILWDQCHLQLQLTAQTT